MRRFIKTVVLVAIALMLVNIPLTPSAWGNPTTPRDRAVQTEREVKELEQVLRALETSIAERSARIVSIGRELQATEVKIGEVTVALERSAMRQRALMLSFGARVRSAYMQGAASYLEAILNAESFGDLIVRMAYLRRVLTRDAELIETVRHEQTRGKEALASLEAEKRRLDSLWQERQAEQRNLLEQRRERERVLVAARTRLSADLLLITPSAERRAVYAVVIDNLANARPQFGLAQAKLIYEYEVEGRITRYLALFANLPKKVGPIRSARAHSAMLALESQSHYIYSSGGVDVLELLRGLNVRGTDALRLNSASFFRDPTRRAPHNLFVNLQTLGRATRSDEILIRPAHLPQQGEPMDRVLVEYSSQHRITYVFVPAQTAYRRYINNEVHRDADGTVIMARNIIVQYVPHRNDLLGRPTPNLIGTGTIDYHALGQHFRGTWRKDNAASPTRFFFEDGTEIEKVFGQTWIQIVRPR